MTTNRPTGPKETTMARTDRAAKTRIADALLNHVGTLVEFWDEMGDPAISQEDAQRQLATWMARLPGTGWDLRLGPPPVKK